MNGNNSGQVCIDCGAKVVTDDTERVGNLYTSRVTRYACGATTRSSNSANGNVSRICHEGCTELE